MRIRILGGCIISFSLKEHIGKRGEPQQPTRKVVKAGMESRHASFLDVPIDASKHA